MEKTANFNLNQWEPHDEIKVEDFNADNAAIDAALGALNTAVAAKGNCSVVSGTYVGTGTYNSTSNTLKFSKSPVALFISGYNYTAVILPGGGFSVGTNSYAYVIYPTWEDDGTVSWRSPTNDFYQMNRSGITYTYFALLA